MVENIDFGVLGVAPGDRVVDVGCASGLMAEQLAQAGLTVVGVEPEAYLREHFERRMRSRGLNARVLPGTVERLPFADGEVRASMLTEVLEHVEDPAVALRELNRVHAPGGILCLSVPTSFTERLFSRLHPRYLSNATHLRIFEREQLVELIRRSGFEVVAIQGRNFAPSVSWIFHALLRSEADHAGVIKQHLWVDRVLGLVWGALGKLRLRDPVLRAGNRVFPKSWYVYCRKPAE